MVTQADKYLIEIARLFPPQGEWTEDDYFALPETNRIIELADGELVIMPPPGIAHQRDVRALFLALHNFVSQNDLGEVFFSPIGLRLWEGNVREPDVMFVSKERLDQIEERVIQGPADWVAEVISKGSRQNDEEKKLAQYARAGIPEYWLLDRSKRTIRVHLLPTGQSVYTLAGTYTAGQVARSETISGFSVTVDEVFNS